MVHADNEIINGKPYLKFTFQDGFAVHVPVDIEEKKTDVPLWNAEYDTESDIANFS